MGKEIQTIYLPASLRRRVRVKAAREGVSLTSVAEQLFERWVKGQIKLEPDKGPS